MCFQLIPYTTVRQTNSLARAGVESFAPCLATQTDIVGIAHHVSLYLFT